MCTLTSCITLVQSIDKPYKHVLNLVKLFDSIFHSPQHKLRCTDILIEKSLTKNTLWCWPTFMSIDQVFTIFLLYYIPRQKLTQTKSFHFCIFFTSTSAYSVCFTFQADWRHFLFPQPQTSFSETRLPLLYN